MRPKRTPMRPARTMGYARGKVEHEMALSDRKQHRMAEQMKCKIYARLLLARG
jgi:hypothetical protein